MRGLHRVHIADGDGPRCQLMGSGVSLPWALEAARLLEQDWGVAADVWSVTSWVELRRDGLAAEEHNFLHPGEPARTAYVADKLRDARGPVVAPTDYASQVPDMIRQFVPHAFATLGADDHGFSDTRAAARRWFHIDVQSMVVRALQLLADEGSVDPGCAGKAAEQYRLLDVNAGTTGTAGGDS